MESIGMAKANRSHQVILKELVIEITDKLDSDYIVLQEPNYDDGDAKSNQPDVLVYNKEDDEMLVSIEVCLKSMVSKEIKKCQQALADYPEIRECFVIAYKPVNTFDYSIVSYTKITRESVIDSSESDTLEIDFADIL